MKPSSKIPRAALVTGGAKRLGRAIVSMLAAEGWAVAVHCNSSREEGEALARQIRSSGGKAEVLGADLCEEAEVETLVSRATEALGPLGCLINNASIFERDEVLYVTRESWDRHMEANLRAPFVLMQAFARSLPLEAEGVVINLTDERVWSLTPHFVSYTLSKAGLWTLTQTMALALAPRIRVNAVGPGPALPSPRQNQEQFDRQCAAMPLKRGTNPEEIAEAVRYILSASAMTGQMIALDGGQHLGWAQPADDTPPEE